MVLGTGLKRIADACEESGVRYEFVRGKLGFTVVFYRPPLWTSDKLEDNVGDNIGENTDNLADKVADKTEAADKLADKVADKTEVADKLAVNLTSGERAFINKILPYFREHEWITNSIACELSGLAEGSVKRFLRLLTDKNVLIAQGVRKARRYRLRTED